MTMMAPPILLADNKQDRPLGGAGVNHDRTRQVVLSANSGIERELPILWQRRHDGSGIRTAAGLNIEREPAVQGTDGNSSLATGELNGSAQAQKV